MGVQGLRKFIDGSSCTKSVLLHTSEAADGEQPPAPQVEHVLIDMNCIVHSCFSRNHSSPKQTIAAVVERVTTLVTRVAVPTKSLTFCFDGPAPIAKLHTQRMRRRKLSHMDLGNNTQFCDLAITTGSTFMVELENRIARHFQRRGAVSSLFPTLPVYIFGSTCKGEGESKIAMALAYHASDVLQYRTGDQVVIFGNDIDLALTALGATAYHNLYVVGASSLQVIAIGDLIYRWMLPSSAFLTDVSQLPSARIDLIFLFSLNGGDHYVGLGEVAVGLWRRYRLVRTQQPQRKIVSDDLLSIDLGFLADIVQIDQYAGDADPSVGSRLLRAALWSTYATVTGIVPNYHFAPLTDAPSLCNIKAALVQLRSSARRHDGIAITVSDKAPLTPLATYVALMPTTETLPESIRRVVTRRPQLAQRLATSNELRIIAQSATEAVSIAVEEKLLSPAEVFLNQFTSPVHVNYFPKAKHLSRHEQHRMIAKGETIEQPAPDPQVFPITPPTNFNYQCSVYRVRDLVFRDPFFGGPEKKLSVANGAASTASTQKLGRDDSVDDDIRRFLGDDAALAELKASDSMSTLTRQEQLAPLATAYEPNRKKARTL